MRDRGSLGEPLAQNKEGHSKGGGMRPGIGGKDGGPWGLARGGRHGLGWGGHAREGKTQGSLGRGICGPSEPPAQSCPHFLLWRLPELVGGAFLRKERRPSGSRGF